MRQAPAVLIPLLLMLAGCLSPPIPQDLLDLGPPPALEPMRPQEVLRLSQAGISDEVILGLIRSRGIVEGPTPVEALLPEPKLVYRELFIPLWPSYARGRWHIGLRIGCYYGAVDEARSKEPRPPTPQPEFIDP